MLSDGMKTPNMKFVFDFTGMSVHSQLQVVAGAGFN
jgi:hypothetical protein